MNERGYCTKRGVEWSAAKVNNILSNPVYIGSLRLNVSEDKKKRIYEEIPGVAPVLLESEVFEQVQKIKVSRKHSHRRTATSHFVFSGLLQCGRCGAPIIGKVSGVSANGKKV